METRGVLLVRTSEVVQLAGPLLVRLTRAPAQNCWSGWRPGQESNLRHPV